MNHWKDHLPFALQGTVVHGKHLGHQIGFPTANIDYPSQENLPPDGVYVGMARIDVTGETYLIIVNQGTQPTAPSGKSTVEAHLIDFEERRLYGETLTLTYHAYLRGEQKFSSLEALVVQLQTDCQNARQWAKENANIRSTQT